MFYKFQKAVVFFSLGLIALFLAYGVITDCPNTEGYVSCKYKFTTE